MTLKRSAEDDGLHGVKRSKIHVSSSDSPGLFDDSQQVNVSDILATGIDRPGHIKGKVLMKWPLVNKMSQIRLQAEEGEGAYGRRTVSLDVHFRGPCTEFPDILNFDFDDVLRLDLKGACLKKTPKSNSGFLEYEEGVIVKYESRTKKPEQNLTVVDLWKLREQRQQAKGRPVSHHKLDEDWFSTPVEVTSEVFPEDESDDTTAVDPAENTKRMTVSPVPDAPTNPSNGYPMQLNELAVTTLRDSSIQLASTQSNKPIVPAISVPNSSTVGKASSIAKLIDIPTRSVNAKVDSLVQPSTHATILPPIQSIDRTSVSAHSNGCDSRVQQPTKHQASAVPPPKQQLTKKAYRALKRKEKKEKQKNEAVSEGSSTAHPAHSLLPNVAAVDFAPTGNQTVSCDVTNPTAPLAPATEESRYPEENSTSKPVALQSSPALQPPAEPRDPALDLRPGVRTPIDYYISISTVQEYREFSIIGVVTSASNPKLTYNNSWSTSITLIDPSNAELQIGYGFRSGDGFKVNCFTPKYKEWLPCPRAGDVLLMRKLKISNFNGNTVGTGYHDKLRWAIYEPLEDRVHHGDLKDVPMEVALDEGFGAHFSPFWTLQEEELAYCKRLANWWRAMQEERKKLLGTVHYIEAPLERKNRREHRLICDTNPDIEPYGFFDCTIEVIHTFENANGVYSVYVTDYTANRAWMPIDTSWCRTDFADRILKIEMWDDAGVHGKEMQIGEYYFLGNVKLRIGASGYYEAKMSLDPICFKLDENDENRVHLQGLIRRKKEWEDKNRSDSHFNHVLVKDIENQRFINCTVEVLHATHKSNDNSYLYVTDYTSNGLLPPVNDSWAVDLSDCVLSIKLNNGQDETAKNIEIGGLYFIRDMQIKRLYQRGLVGSLGGSGRHIHKLKIKDTGNEDLQALIRRKQEWEQRNAGSRLTDIDAHQRSDSEELDITIPVRHPRSASLPSGSSTIVQIRSSEKSPNKFKLIARIVDFCPLKLSQCFFLRCTRCNKNLPKNMKGCMVCDDEPNPVRCFVRLFLRLQDAEGSEMVVSAFDKDCSLLPGFEPDDPQDDPAVLVRFHDHLKPILGNLFEVHDAIDKNIHVPPQTPFLKCMIHSWPLDDDGERSIKYALMRVEPEHSS